MVVKDTIRLMRIIGVPGLIKGIDAPQLDDRILALAELNKVQMILYPERYGERYSEFLDFLEYIVGKMNRFEYTVVKTIRPFPRIPADVDLVVHRRDLGRVLGMFIHDGLVLIDKAPYGATLYSRRHGYYLDVATDLSVSGLVYIGGDFLINHSRDRVVDGVRVRAPEEPLDLLAVASHSVIKEWMFTLSDYYTAALWLRHLADALRYAEKLHLLKSLTLFMSLVRELSNLAYGPNNPVGSSLRGFKGLGTGFIRHDLPIKYRPGMLMPCYVEKLMDNNALSSIPNAVAFTFNSKFMRMLINHITRVSY